MSVSEWVGGWVGGVKQYSRIDNFFFAEFGACQCWLAAAAAAAAAAATVEECQTQFLLGPHSERALVFLLPSPGKPAARLFSFGCSLLLVAAGSSCCACVELGFAVGSAAAAAAAST